MKKWTLIPSFSELFWKYVKPKQLVFFECSLRKLSKKVLILFANPSTYTFYLWPIPSPVCGGVSCIHPWLVRVAILDGPDSPDWSAVRGLT